MGRREVEKQRAYAYKRHKAANLLQQAWSGGYTRACAKEFTELFVAGRCERVQLQLYSLTAGALVDKRSYVSAEALARWCSSVLTAFCCVALGFGCNLESWVMR